ncbi:hypothetical protein K491DRAFT_671002 [Lophiostoma macrostomum CBS 122681]|uniref:Ketopantoate reductase N-terminal domain-containing protein n=1 Tax=Lophiostoma macrostomum CBS 122681 TaxID=1314788 RepID=A0A6A6SKC4_9PLEO|nr:hypothetical protein K491DRAFT_671002 [Lophiostoma macrostomum CBS 122681]
MAAPKPRVLIVGAGSMGIVTGYHLSLAGAHTTFLIRPHRASQLSRPQKLYSYDSNTLHTYSDFSYITEPAVLLSPAHSGENAYDFIVITLDGAALKSATGIELVKTIGDVGQRNKDTKILLGTIGVDLHTWFTAQSGLPGDRVTLAWLTLHVYSPSAVTLPLPPAQSSSVVDPELLQQADQAYTAKIGGYWISDDSPAVQTAFAALWDKSGVPSACKDKTQFSVEGLPVFAIFAAEEALGWPSFEVFNSSTSSSNDDRKTKETWKLTIGAGKEIAELGIHGEMGKRAVQAITEDGTAQRMWGLEQMMWPFPFVAFSEYHHGGKVNGQDRELLRECLRGGREEGKGMERLGELIGRVWG